MKPVTIVLLVIVILLAIALVVLYFLGKRAQKKQDEQQAQIDAAKQSVSMLIIDKKRMKLKESGLPQAVIEQAQKDKKADEITEAEKNDLADVEKKIADEKGKKEAVIAKYASGNKVVHQLIDLALLQNGMLKGEALNNFVKRSIELI